jgi:hypothetical protein
MMRVNVSNFSELFICKLKLIYVLFYNWSTGFQKWIGYAGMKSVPVHFYVQRSSSFNSTGIPISFDLTRLNEGTAMNLTSGIFTAPRTGTYFFSFTGLAQFPVSSSLFYLGVSLKLNNNSMGLAWVQDANTVAGAFFPLTLQSTLKLKKGDAVWVEITSSMPSGVNLFDNGNHHTHFTGFVLEEEIVASL